MSDFASERNVTARTPHRCGECFRTIQPGEVYQRAAGRWWGDFWHMTTCAHCAHLRPLVREFCPDYDEDYYGGLLDCLYGDTSGLPTDVLRAFVNMRRRWTRRDGTLVDLPGGVA